LLIEFLRAIRSIQVENAIKQGITKDFFEIPFFRWHEENAESCRKNHAEISGHWYLQSMGLANFATEKSTSKECSRD